MFDVSYSLCRHFTDFALLKIKKIHDAWKDLEKTQKMSQFEPPIFNRLEMAAS
jgi:hypothetical protein